jgi:hypothetical protein
LKRPIEKKESVCQRWTNNTMVNRKGTKGQTIQWSIEKEQKDKQYNGQ